MKKNLLKMLSLLVVAMMLFAAPVSAEARDSLVWAMSADPASLDPMNTASMNTFTITYALYDCLTISDGNGGYKPHLADDVLVSEDGLTYTIKLGKDVYFHDGSKMTAEDVKYSLDRTIAAELFADKEYPWQALVGITVIASGSAPSLISATR